MNPLNWIRARAAGAWGGSECPHGAPVPTFEPCEDCDAISLVDLEEQGTVRVSCLLDPGSSTAIRLASAGILPGAEVTLLQRWPAFVLRIGYAELAIDRETASLIRVRRGDDEVDEGRWKAMKDDERR